MHPLDNLITDIASIVASCRPGELMTLKKIEENYRLIYNRPIPHSDFGYSSLEKLLESHPGYFKFSTADGLLIIRPNIETNITELIAKEKKSIKSKNSITGINNQSNSIFKKHRRRDMQIEPQLPVITMKNIAEILNSYDKTPLLKGEFLKLFQFTCGYELKYKDYGFLHMDNLIEYLNGKVLLCSKNQIFPLRNSSKNTTIFDYLYKILETETGFTLSIIQDYISSYDDKINRISEMMKSEGFVNFIDVIYDAASRKILSYDFDLIYPFNNRIAPKCPLYPIGGVNEIRFLSVNTPNDFYFAINSSRQQPSLDYIDERMQQLASQMQLLSMFKEHKICAVEYDSCWYRAQIISLCCNKNYESVSLRFIDHCIEIEHGIKITLPTDRLRFLPEELELIPGFIHKGSLAYVKPIGGGYKWNKEACDVFSSLVTDNSRIYQSFVVGHCETLDSLVTIDVVAWTERDEKISIFYELVKHNVVAIDLN